MSTPLHSPGPWQKGSEYSCSSDEIEDSEGRTIAAVWTRSCPGRVGGPRPCFKDDPKGMANFRLMLAAPKLLAALEEAVEYLEANRPKGKIRDIFHALNQYENGVMKPARQAIVDAKGDV